jgi:transposase
VPKSRQNDIPDSPQILQWHPIPKLPSLEYAHPKVKETIEDLVSTADAIHRENVLLQKEVYRLREQLKIYEARLLKKFPEKKAKDSHNCHQPPSWDHLIKVKRTQSQRQKSFRPVGGQEGHPGSTLELTSHPNQIKRHALHNCSNCHCSLKDIQNVGIERRQIYDLILPKLNVIEHQTEKKICPHCKKLQQSKFPQEVPSDTQYGSKLKSWVIYFMNYQLIPYERTAEICEDLIQHRPSLGTLNRFAHEGFKKLKKTELKIKAALTQTEVLHVDESGIDCNGKIEWLHVASTEKLTHFAAHPNRGTNAIEEIGIIPEFRGTLVHDHFQPYFCYTNASHALCNAHHLRELTFIQESENEEWAGAMKCFLLEVNEVVKTWNKRGFQLPIEKIEKLEAEYDLILQKGFAFHKKKTKPPPDQQKAKSKNGKRKQAPGLNLLNRLRNRKSNVLVFLRNSSVPFTNNRAERDLRMNKLKQKISGCFRSHGGAQIFCRIRSYISSCRKQGHSPLDALEKAIKLHPIQLT